MIDEEFKSVPSITLDEEDIARRHGRRGATSVLPGAKVSKRGASGVDKVILGLSAAILVALAGIAWLYHGLQQSTQQLTAAAMRIEQLEARLVSTDTTLTKSEVLLADKLKSIDQLLETNKTEIRKLWGLAGDVQRKAIEQAKATNEQQSATLKSLQEQLAASGQKLEAQQTSLDLLTVTTKNSEASAREAVQRMEIAQEKVGLLDGDVKTLKQKQSQLETDYSKRIATLEDTAKSTDVFRRNTQEELRKLREELLRQSIPASKSGL